MNPQALQQIRKLQSLIDAANEQIDSLCDDGVTIKIRFNEYVAGKQSPQLELYYATETIDYLKL